MLGNREKERERERERDRERESWKGLRKSYHKQTRYEHDRVSSVGKQCNLFDGGREREREREKQSADVASA
jgi:hypothetical protein